MSPVILETRETRFLSTSAGGSVKKIGDDHRNVKQTKKIIVAEASVEMKSILR